MSGTSTPPGRDAMNCDDEDRAPYEGSAYQVISKMPLPRALARLTADDRATVRPGAIARAS